MVPTVHPAVLMEAKAGVVVVMVVVVVAVVAVVAVVDMVVNKAWRQTNLVCKAKIVYSSAFKSNCG
jgi:uncharacterized BrkB/YihY/UPF0761 family membrane protein